MQLSPRVVLAKTRLCAEPNTCRKKLGLHYGSKPVRHRRISSLVRNQLWKNLNGGSQTGALAPNFQRISGGNRPWKIGPFGAAWGLSMVYRGLFGADRDQFLRTSQPQRRREVAPNFRKGLFGPIGAFQANPVPTRFKRKIAAPESL